MLTALPRITLKPTHYVLAWDHVTAPSYRVKYEVMNGGESNEFSTSNMTFALINANGEATTRGPGACIVSAHPVGLSHLKAYAKVITFIEQNFIFLHIVLFSSTFYRLLAWLCLINTWRLKWDRGLISPSL